MAFRDVGRVSRFEHHARVDDVGADGWRHIGAVATASTTTPDGDPRCS